jgi:5-formyltetrahydrofolate cyclo-ligase
MKDEIRRKLISLRKNLSKVDVLEKSGKIKQRLFKMKQFKEASNILFYCSYDNEVYTHDMIKDSIAINKNVVVPVIDKKNNTLILSRLECWNDLCLGSYNILEPTKEKLKEIPITKIDLIIVPGVGFDLHGHRIGHGKGYYDSLLKNSNAPTIGLAFEIQIVKNIPFEKHDVHMDKILTEKRLIICKE